MMSRNLTAVALVLSLGATPLAAQSDSGGAGDAGDAGDAGAAADAGATGGTTGAEGGAAADGEAGATADAGGEAGTTADAGEEGATDASAGADQPDGSDTTGMDGPTEQADADEGVETPGDATAMPETDVTGADGGEVGTAADADRQTPPDVESQAAEENVARFELGTLTCDLEGWTNALIYAEESFDCVFVDEQGRTAAYDGAISKLGANLQIKGDQRLEWIVLSSITADEPHDLSGTYLGASAQASLGLGAGANLLIGGSGDNFTLQPVSVTGQEGLGASLTIDTLTLSRVD